MPQRQGLTKRNGHRSTQRHGCHPVRPRSGQFQEHQARIVLAGPGISTFGHSHDARAAGERADTPLGISHRDDVDEGTWPQQRRDGAIGKPNRHSRRVPGAGRGALHPADEPRVGQWFSAPGRAGQHPADGGFGPGQYAVRKCAARQPHDTQVGRLELAPRGDVATCHDGRGAWLTRTGRRPDSQHRCRCHQQHREDATDAGGRQDSSADVTAGPRTAGKPRNKGAKHTGDVRHASNATVRSVRLPPAATPPVDNSALVDNLPLRARGQAKSSDSRAMVRMSRRIRRR